MIDSIHNHRQRYRMADDVIEAASEEVEMPEATLPALHPVLAGMNLARVPDAPGVVSITSSTVVPSIVRHLNRVKTDPLTFATEKGRYAGIENLSATDKAVMAAHDALEEGRALINIQEMLIKRDNGATFPTLAIGHVGDRKVYCRVWNGGVVQFNMRHGRKHTPRRTFYEYSNQTFGSGLTEGSWTQASAQVPTLPPEIRGKVRRNQQGYLLLWEAHWENVTRKPPPRPILDPALLEHVAGSLYAVVAVWDLSKIEAAALGRPVK